MKYISFLIFLSAYFVSPQLKVYSQAVTLYNTDSTLMGTGVMQQGKMEGLWKFLNPTNKSIIQQGNFSAGQKDGRWISYHPNGAPHIEAEYRNNSLSGAYREFDRDGTLVLESVLEDSLLVGPYRTYYSLNETPGQRKPQIKTEGTYKNGKKTGTMISYFPNGQVAIRQNYQDDKLEGAYQEFDPSGELIVETTYKNNRPHGKYRRFAGGLVEVEGEYDMGRRVGEWRKYFPFTRVLESETYYDNRGNRTGEWVYYYENRRIARVERYENDIPSGVWEEFYPNRNLAKRKTYELGMPKGEYIEDHSNGNPSVRGQYENGVRAGMWKSYFPDGEVYSLGEYKNDVKSGLWKFFNRIGILIAEGEFQLGSEHGQWFYYYDGGQLKSVGSYFFGFEDGVWGLFYDNRQLTQEETWSNGRLMNVGEYYNYDGSKTLDRGTLQDGNGTRITYYVNGRKESEGSYTNGKPEGVWKYFHDNGRLASEGQMVDGKKEGQWKYYNRNGRLDEVLIFENDEVVPLEDPVNDLPFQIFN